MWQKTVWDIEVVDLFVQTILDDLLVMDTEFLNEKQGLG